MIVGIVLDSSYSHRLVQQFYYPLVIVRNAVPGHVDGVRCRVVEFEVKRLDTRRIFELHIIDDDIATHHQVGSQTGRDRQLIVRQIVVREDETCLLERRSADINRIKGHKAVLIGDVVHRTDNHYTFGRSRTGIGAHIKREQHIGEETCHNRQDSHRAVDRTRRIELQRLVAIIGRTGLIDTRIIHTHVIGQLPATCRLATRVVVLKGLLVWESLFLTRRAERHLGPPFHITGSTHIEVIVGVLHQIIEIEGRRILIVGPGERRIQHYATDSGDLLLGLINTLRLCERRTREEELPLA